MPAWQRFARITALAFCLGLGIAIPVAEVGDWYLSDLDVYLRAADQIRAGASPYVMASTDIHDAFRYAPWFAYAFVPFTLVPLQVARVIWSAILIGASIAAAIPVVRRGPGGVALGVLGGGILLGVAGSGNVQPLLIAALVHGIGRRSGPAWIALAASLKVVPLVFAGYYLARRAWWRLAASVLLTMLLVAPMALYERPAIIFDPGESLSLYTVSPLLWATGAAVGLLAAFAASWRRARHVGAYLVAATLLLLPRFFVYDISFALPGTVDDSPRAPG